MRRISGAEAQVRAHSTQEGGVCFVRDDGTPYGIIRATGNPDKQSIISEYEILRGDLSRVLHDMTHENESMEYVFGEPIASIRQSEKLSGPIKVEIANHVPTAEYDLIVACGGAFPEVELWASSVLFEITWNQRMVGQPTFPWMTTISTAAR